MKICPKCGINHTKSGKFCSRSCANSRTWSEEDKLARSISLKNSEKCKLANEKQKLPNIIKNCIICNKEMTIKSTSNKKCCSRECVHKFISINNKNKTGGYREGSGRSISGYYQNIYCGSTYELVWVMYNLHHNIPFKRFDGYIIYDENKKYYPDFILNDNTIIEIKGYHTDTVDIKCQAAIQQGYNIKVLYKQDLKEMFDWFNITFPNKKLQEMYQDYKPKYTYICSNCNNEFNTNSKRTTNEKFCSRQCAGKSMHNKNIGLPTGY